jgi:hypothetical protein
MGRANPYHFPQTFPPAENNRRYPSPVAPPAQPRAG